MNIEKCQKKTRCRACTKWMEAKDWRVALKWGKVKMYYFHLTCYLKWAEKKKNDLSHIIRKIKSHKSILAKEKEKLILRAI